VSGGMHWDRGAPAPPVLDFLAVHPVRGRVLVPGCGAGHEVRALAAAGASVLGVDFAPGALGQAAAHPRAGGEDYLLADFLDLPAHLHGTFDWIVEHTCFCAIEPSRRVDYVRACRDALVPGGKVLAVFYLDPRDPGGDTPPFGVAVAELDRLFGEAFAMVSESVPARCFEGREGRELVRLLARHP
jgi:methyl halide transferase